MEDKRGFVLNTLFSIFEQSIINQSVNELQNMIVLLKYYIIILFYNTFFNFCIILKIISILTVLSSILLVIIAKFYTYSYNIRLRFNFYVQYLVVQMFEE